MRSLHSLCSNAWRTTSAECRERERLEADMYNDVRQAAEVHRAVRKYIKTVAVPGVRLFDMCETLEASVRALIEEKGLQARGAGLDSEDVGPAQSIQIRFRTGGLHIESLARQHPMATAGAQARPQRAPRARGRAGANRICVARRAPCRNVRMRKPHIHSDPCPLCAKRTTHTAASHVPSCHVSALIFAPPSRRALPSPPAARSTTSPRTGRPTRYANRHTP
jgi:hypothetical protein